MKSILVIGAGQMGTGITQHLAIKNFKVTLMDYKESNIRSSTNKIKGNLNKLHEKDQISKEELTTLLKNITYTTDLKVKDIDLIIEAIPEDFLKKETLIKNLNEIIEDYTILATNTSSYSITKLSSMFKDPSRFIGLHFFNPAVIMPLVEVVKGKDTSLRTVESLSDFISKIDKSPVYVNDHPGFVVNRILIPMINEAILVLQEGISSPEDIDKAMKLGSNHPMGPLELADYIGLDTCLSIMETLYKELGGEKYRPADLLYSYVQKNHLGKKTNKGFYIY